MYKRIIFLILALTLIFSILTLQSTTSTGSVNTETALTKNEFSPSKYGATGTNETKPYGGTLRVGLWEVMRFPWTLNPLLDVITALEAGGYNVFSRLARYDENGSCVPDLAYDWEISDDGLNFTFYLYQNVTWHDGVEFNASDVKFTFDTVLFNDDVDWYWKMKVTSLTVVNIVGPFTVVLNLEESHSSFLKNIAMIPIIPEHLYNGTDLHSNPYNNNPIGTGPFKHASWNKSVNWLLEANPTYFRGRPYLDRIDLRFDVLISDLHEHLANNEVDLVPGRSSTLPAPDVLQTLTDMPGMTVMFRDSFGWTALGINLNNSILTHLKVREALAHAINKTALIEDVYLGYARSSTSSIPPAATFWYNPNVTEYEFNLTLANELLDEAGYPIDPETGYRFGFSLKVMDIEQYRINATEMIGDWFAEIGINTSIQIQPFSQFWDDVYNRRDFDIAFNGIAWQSGWDPAEQYELWHSDSFPNPWNYSNPTVDTLLEQGRETYNDIERKIIFDEIQKILADDLPNVFLFHAKIIASYNNDFHGFVSGCGVLTELDSYSLERVWYEPTLSGEGSCPYWICYMHNGKRTGYHPWYGELTQIPNSTYSGIDSDPQVVKLRSPKGLYYLDIICKDNGTHKYEVEIVNIALTYKHVQIVKGTLIGRSIIHRIKRYVINISEDGSMTVTEIRIGGRPRDIFPLPY